SQHLKADGRIYLDQANYGAVNEMKKMAGKAGFSVRKIAAKTYPKHRELAGLTFYAFELRRKK
ncbi:MAG: methyltransferase, partial [Candidatus Micrarchaeota archaeon]|nr:methyltransferase [Candidatus Micrarchaeota archaeon]